MGKSADRQTLEKVAAGYKDLMALQSQQRETMAKMLRACLHRLGQPSAIARKEAMKGLSDLADMLEGKDDG